MRVLGWHHMQFLLPDNGHRVLVSVTYFFSSLSLIFFCINEQSTQAEYDQKKSLFDLQFFFQGPGPHHALFSETLCYSLTLSRANCYHSAREIAERFEYTLPEDLLKERHFLENEEVLKKDYHCDANTSSDSLSKYKLPQYDLRKGLGKLGWRHKLLGLVDCLIASKRYFDLYDLVLPILETVEVGIPSFLILKFTEVSQIFDGLDLSFATEENIRALNLDMAWPGALHPNKNITRKSEEYAFNGYLALEFMLEFGNHTPNFRYCAGIVVGNRYLETAQYVLAFSFWLRAYHDLFTSSAVLSGANKHDSDEIEVFLTKTVQDLTIALQGKYQNLTPKIVDDAPYLLKSLLLSNASRTLIEYENWVRTNLIPLFELCPSLDSETRLINSLDEEPDIFLLHDTIVIPKWSKPPFPRFSSQEIMDLHCRNHFWYFCDGPKMFDAFQPGYDPQYWTGVGRLVVSRISCAMIFSVLNDQGIFEAHVRDKSRRIVFSLQNDVFPAFKMDRLSSETAFYDHAIFHATEYSGPFAHMFESLPRLLMLLEISPKEARLILPRSDAYEGLVALLHSLQILEIDRLVWWNPRIAYNVGTLFVAGEMCYINGSWKVQKDYECGSKTMLQYSKLRKFFLPLLNASSQQKKLRVIIVSREDAVDRRVKNHMEVMEAVRRYYGEGAEVVEFVASQHSLEDQVKLFLEAQVVISPHGAAMVLALLMDPQKSAVVEIAYDGHDYLWNAPFFTSMFASNNLPHYVTMGVGNYYGDIDADIPDLLLLLDLITLSEQ